MSSPRIYDLPTRVFHWTFAGLFVAAYTIGSTVDDASPRFVLHMLAGGLLAAAVLLRLVWGVAGTRHARLSDFSLSPAALVGYLRGVLSGQARTWAGHDPASSWAALVMMGLGLGMAATGLAMVAGVAPTRSRRSTRCSPMPSWPWRCCTWPACWCTYCDTATRFR